MKNDIFLFVFVIIQCALCFFAEAQQPAKVPRLGYVGGSGTSNNPQSSFNILRQGLRELGYIEGKNISIEYRNAEGKLDLIPQLVEELIRHKVDLLVTTNPEAMRAAKQATQTIPIVIVSSSDPVAMGIVDSLARPGGNITGISLLVRDLSGKRLSLLTEAVAAIKRVAVLWDPDSAAATIGFKEYESAGRSMKIAVQTVELRGPNPDLHGAFQAMVKERANALIAVRTSALNRLARQIADLAAKNRLPSMFEFGLYAEAGGLMSYSASDVESFRRAAIFVDKILKGAKPADLPVEQPTKFEFVINLKTAKQIGIEIPQSVLFRADKVIK
jgi:ABC-type uncharacterized transport system substrate-binding protein